MMTPPRSVLPPSPSLFQLTSEMVEKRPCANLPCLGSAFDSFCREAIARYGKGGRSVTLAADIELVWSCLPRTSCSVSRQDRLDAGLRLLKVWLQSDLKGADALEAATTFFQTALSLSEQMKGVSQQTEDCDRVGGIALLSLLRLSKVAPSSCGSPPPTSASISSLASTFSLACSHLRDLNSTGESILSGALTCLLCRRELQPVWDVEVVPALRRLAAETVGEERADHASCGLKRNLSKDTSCSALTTAFLPPLASA